MRTITGVVATPARYDEQTKTMYGGVYADGVLQQDCLRPDYGAWRSVDPAQLPPIEVETYLPEALYCGRFFAHFGHFLIETLPALHWAQDFDGPLLWHPWPAHLTPVDTRMRFIRFFFDALAVSESRIFFAGPSYGVGVLVVPPQSRIIFGESKIPLRSFYLRIAEYAQAIENGPERIYFSRRKFAGQSRPIKDELLVERIFEKFGFTVVWPEKLHIETQIGLVRGAKVVAGVDGSALHLCAFMKEGGQCLVLESRKVPAIYAINDAAGIRTIGLPVCAWDESDGARKTLININQLESELKRLL